MGMSIQKEDCRSNTIQNGILSTKLHIPSIVNNEWNCSLQPFGQIKNELVSGRLAYRSNKIQTFDTKFLCRDRFLSHLITYTCYVALRKQKKKKILYSFVLFFSFRFFNIIINIHVWVINSNK